MMMKTSLRTKKHTQSKGEYNNMKKKLVIMALCTAFLLAGCGNKNATASSASSVSETSSTASGTGSTSSVSEASSAAESTANSNSGDGAYDSAPTTTQTVSGDDYSAFLNMPNYKGYQLNAPADTAAKNGMIVNIDYVGTINGTAFDGGTGSNYDLTLGSGQFIDGFEDQLVGHKKGDVVDVVVTFPKDYGVDSLNGKEAHFKTTINQVKYFTKDSALSDLRDRTTVKNYPQDLLNQWVQANKDSYKSAAQSQNQDLDAYLKSIGVTDDMLETNAKNAAKTDMITHTIAAKEGITKDSEEYKKAAQSITLANGQVVTESVAESYGISSQELESSIYYNIAADIIEKYQAKA